ncbi:MAG: hypothetical protein ACLRZ9_05690 [Eubacterium sp.]
MNIQELRTKQSDALNAYKSVKLAFMETVTKNNIKGDFQKWKEFCDAKAVCCRLGVRI